MKWNVVRIIMKAYAYSGGQFLFIAFSLLNQVDRA